MPQSDLETQADPSVDLIDLLSSTGYEGLDAEARLSLVEGASLEGYMGAVDAIHRKVAPDESPDLHPEPVKIVNPTTGEVRRYAARPEERAGIMTHALELAQRVARKYRAEGGSIDDTLQRCGNLAAFGVVLAHNYENGNGRTARTLGELVHNGFDRARPDAIDDLATISANRPDSGFRINSYVPSMGWSEGRADEDPMAFLDVVAALDVPLDSSSYALVAQTAFTTPRM